MKIRVFLFSFLAVLFIFLSSITADSGYRQVNTSVGKVIIGLDKDSALEKFGVPQEASDNIWYYSTPEGFYVTFARGSLVDIYLYPRDLRAYVDVPVEFKAFGYFSDMRIKDITSEAQLIISEPERFLLEKPGIVIPKRPGDYQVLAKYDGVFSNPAYLKVEEPGGREVYAEKLISITVLPYKPQVPYQGKCEFRALGIFLDSAGTHSVRDMTERVTWYRRQGNQTTANRSNAITFDSLGKAAVFCVYRDMESPLREVKVQKDALLGGNTLKHITLMPEFISVANGKSMDLRAFGTYRNNWVEDITGKVKWEAGDTNVVSARGSGLFLAKNPGVTEVSAGLDDIKSLPVKIIVTGEAESSGLMRMQEREINPEKLTKDIRDEVERLKDDLAMKEKALTLVRINPESFDIPAGESRRASAQGVYSDSSLEDLTNLGEWSISDDKVARVAAGKIDAYSPGTARIYVSFKGIKSLPASVKVTGPELVSVILTPQGLQLPMGASRVFKAEGYFSDSSRRDITELAEWNIDNPRVIKIIKGRIRPLNFGRASVTAGYSGVKSLPATVRVVFTADWLMRAAIKGVSFLLLVIFAAFGILYILTERKMNILKSSMDKDPRRFIIGLYENAKIILNIFGLRYKEDIPPLSYAESVRGKYSIESSLFSRLTVKFEEASYSNHPLAKSDASSALDDYNGFLEILASRHGKLGLFLKYCLALLQRTPFFISKS